MSSQKLNSDSGVPLNPLKPQSKIPTRVARSSNGSAQNSDEESGRKKRTSRGTRIPIAVSRQTSGSHSGTSDEDHRTPSLKATDAGINLKRVQKDDCVQKLENNATRTSLPSKKSAQEKISKHVSPRDTKASALRKQAQLQKAVASFEKPKQGKGKQFLAVHCGHVVEFPSDDAKEKQVQSAHAPLELRDVVDDQSVESDWFSETTPSLDQSSSPCNAEYSGCNSTDGEEESQDITDTEKDGEQLRHWDTSERAKNTQRPDDKDRNDAVQLEDKTGTPDNGNVRKAAESYCNDSIKAEASSPLSESVDKVEKRQTAEGNLGDSDNEHVRDLKEKQVCCEKTEEIPSLLENGNSAHVEHAEQENMACDNSENVMDLEDQPVFCNESKEYSTGLPLGQTQSVQKFFDVVSNQGDSGGFKDEERERGETHGLREHEEQPYHGSRTVEETPSPVMDIAGETELERRKTEDHDCHKSEKENKSMARDPSVTNDDKGCEHQKDRFKNYMAQKMCEIKKQHSLILEMSAQVSDIARPLVKDNDFVSPLIQVEKEVQLVQDELRQARDESKHAFNERKMGKAKYKKLKKRFRCNKEKINSLVQACQRDLEKRKEKETVFQHQIQHDMGQIRLLLKKVLKNEVSSSKEGEQSTFKDGFENHFERITREMNDILEKIMLRLKRNENEQELERIALRQEETNVQGLENTFQEFQARLQQNECDLESIKRKLKERDNRVEALNRKLQKEREDMKGLRMSVELVEGHAIQQIMDKDSEINTLQQLLSDAGERSDKLQEHLRKTERELENTEDILTQRDIELSEAKALLCQGDKIICDFKQTLTEVQHKLEETKKALAAKDKASERYADDAVGVLKELVTNVIRNVKTVEQAHVKLQTLLVDKDKNIEDKKLFILQLKEGLETVIIELKNDLDRHISSLKEKDERVNELESSIASLKTDLEMKTSSLREKDNEIKDLKSSIAQCEKNLELSGASLKEKKRTIDDLEASIAQLEEDMEVASISLNGRDNELQQIQRYVQEKERELDICTGKGILLQEENNCLKNKYMMSTTRLSQLKDEIQKLKTLAFTRNSELREENRELEKLRHLLQEKEQKIDFMKRSLAAKEHDNDILTGNMKKRFSEIRSLQRTLDEVNNEHRKLSELYRLKTSYFETKIERLNLEVKCNLTLLEKKERAIETANLGIQAKEGELDILKDRLCKQEMKFELYKKISTEAEYKLLQEKRSLEKNMKVTETGLCEKDRVSAGVESSSSAKESDHETIDDWSSDESNRLFWGGKGEVMIGKGVEEQTAVTGTKRLSQMEGYIIALTKELKRSQDNNVMLSKKNKELKEKVNKLQKQTVLERKRLNNTLDNVHMKAVQIFRLKTLLNKQTEARSIKDDDKQQLPEATVVGAEPNNPENVQGTDDSLIKDKVPQESGESQVPMDDCMQKTADPNIEVASQMTEDAQRELDDPEVAGDVPQESGELNLLVDDHTLQDGTESQVSEIANLELDDLEITEDTQRELDDPEVADDVPHNRQAERKVRVDNYTKDVPEPLVSEDATKEMEHSQLTEDDPQESGEPQLPVDDNMQAEPKVLADDRMKDVPEPLATQEREHLQLTQDAQQELDDPLESGELQLPLVDDRQGLAESQVDEFPQESETPESSISSVSLSLSDLGL